MDKRIVKNGNELNLSITGRLDASSSEEFLEAVQQQLDQDITTVSIDCTGFEYVSSAGLRALMAIYNTMSEKEGGCVRLLGVGDQVNEVLQLTGMNELFQFE